MDHSTLLTYFVAVVALTAAPGPIIAVLVARSLERNVRGAAAFAGGLVLGDVLAVLAVAMGVGVWAEAKPEWLALAKYVGVAYLLWLSVRIWNDVSGVALAQGEHGGPLASFSAGAALCLGNPATLLIYMLLLPGVAPQGFQSNGQIAAVLAITFLAVGLVFFGAILFARQARRVIGSPASATLAGRVVAATIAVTSLWILAA